MTSPRRTVRRAWLFPAMGAAIGAIIFAWALPLFVSGQTAAPQLVSDTLAQIDLSSPQLDPRFSYVSINKFGYNPNIQTAEEVIWVGSTTFNYPAGMTALTMTVVSDDTDDDSTGTGARTVLVSCLDGSGVPFTETVTLDGTTPVTMASDCWRIYRAKVITAGSQGENDGVLTFANGGTTYQLIAAERNQTETASYTCPAATRCVVESVVTATDDNIEFSMYERPFGQVFHPAFKHQMDALENQTWWWSCVPALTDIECRAVSLSGIAEVGCSFRVHHVAEESGECG